MVRQFLAAKAMAIRQSSATALMSLTPPEALLHELGDLLTKLFTDELLSCGYNQASPTAMW